MKSPWFWKRGKKLNKRDYKKLHAGFHSEEIFKQILVRECIRCDRNGHRFSLVIFEVEEKTQEAFEILVKILRNRHARLCDEFGWYHEQQIAVILCYTDRQSALVYAEDIRGKVSSEGQSIKFAIYEYPDNWQEIYSESRSFQKHHFNRTHRERSDKENSGWSSSHVRSDERRTSAVDPIRYNKQDWNRSRHTNETPCFFTYGTPAWKRVIDVIGSFSGLVVLFPLILFLSLVIKILTRGGPVFVKEERVGFLGKRVTLWKFQTMNTCNDKREKSRTSLGR